MVGKNFSFSPFSVCKHIELRLVEIEDCEFILNLRTDPELNKYISPVNNDLESQKAWIQSYKKREANSMEYYFIIQSLNGNPFGTVRMYDFRGGSFCWGSWLIARNTPFFVAIESSLSIYELGFFTLGFDKSHFDVRKNNIRVVRFHQQFGARLINEDDENYYFNFERFEYENTKKRYSRFLR